MTAALLLFFIFLLFIVICATVIQCYETLQSLKIGDVICYYDKLAVGKSSYSVIIKERVVYIDRIRNIVQTDKGNRFTLYEFWMLNITKEQED